MLVAVGTTVKDRLSLVCVDRCRLSETQIKILQHILTLTKAENFSWSYR